MSISTGSGNLMDTPDDRRLRDWVANYLTRRMMLCFLGAFVCALIGIGVLWLSWWTIYGIIWFILLSFSPPALPIFIATWVIFVLLFVAYATANWPHLENLQTESPARLRAARAAAILTDSPFLALAGPKTFGTFVKAVSAVALVGPGTMMTSWRLLLQARAAWRGSPDQVAEILKTLATVGVRVPLDELLRSDPTDRFVPTFQAVQLFDGIILRTSEPVGVVLSDGLREEVLAQIPADQQRPMGAKPPPGRVSSPRPAGKASPAAAPSVKTPPAKAPPSKMPPSPAPTAKAPPSKSPPGKAPPPSADPKRKPLP